MAYVGTPRPSGRTPSAIPSAAGGADASSPAPGRRGARGTPRREPTYPPEPEPADGAGMDWAGVAIFGAGLAAGLVLGAGITAFTTPASGSEARRAVRRGALRALWQGQDAWEDLREELAHAAARKRKELRRRRRNRGM